MSISETRNKILLALAKAYEEGKGHSIGFENQTEEEKKIIAELKSEGYIEMQGSSTFRFSAKGYSHFKNLVSALKI